MISDAFSFKLNWDAICPAPFCMNTRKKDTRIITKVLNLLSQETIMAVKPLPPAVLVEIVWLAPPTMIKPAIPCGEG